MLESAMLLERTYFSIMYGGCSWIVLDNEQGDFIQVHKLYSNVRHIMSVAFGVDDLHERVSKAFVMEQHFCAIGFIDFHSGNRTEAEMERLEALSSALESIFYAHAIIIKTEAEFRSVTLKKAVSGLTLFVKPVLDGMIAVDMLCPHHGVFRSINAKNGRLKGLETHVNRVNGTEIGFDFSAMLTTRMTCVSIL